MKKFYIVLAILGFILPYTQFISWLSVNGLDVVLLFQEIIESKITLFAWIDVIISAIVLIVFILIEGKKQKMNKLWLPIFGTLLVGVSFGLPLFLFMREIQIDKNI
ncbi:hypothetical protein CRV01_10380 [Arcobacter sp. CECT 8983]|uniref:DUF2834 domain-containing protein n=1 Tax=Arcobacter sp. CECT 8983 TaxID=2044508 RepID=UPI00100AB946|nr:DUF2834 domain-containing protein [Arcobacter sp. CECT 8983]RXJ89018.1 hypothetical protein CRV01_10380 [Arcobacter sp. CECT 8983]